MATVQHPEFYSVATYSPRHLTHGKPYRRKKYLVETSISILFEFLIQKETSCVFCIMHPLSSYPFFHWLTFLQGGESEVILFARNPMRCRDENRFRLMRRKMKAICSQSCTDRDNFFRHIELQQPEYIELFESVQGVSRMLIECFFRCLFLHESSFQHIG